MSIWSNRKIPSDVVNYLLSVILSESGVGTAQTKRIQPPVDVFELPRNASFIEPLLRHYLARNSEEPNNIYKTNHYVLKPHSFQQLFQNDVIRKREIYELIDSVCKTTKDRIIGIKGIDICRFYPSQALREMEDCDMVCSTDDARIIEHAAKKSKWKKINSSTLRSPKGVLLELLHPSSFWSRRVVECSTFEENEAVFGYPSLAHEFMIIAIHAAKHRGTRIWRDLCDAMMIISRVEDRDKFQKDILRELKYCSLKQRSNIVSFCCFIDSEYQKERATFFPKFQRFKSNKILQTKVTHYKIMLRLDMSEAEFMVIDNLLQSPFSLFQKIFAANKNNGSKSASGQRDIAFGEFDAPGTSSRKFQKVAVVLKTLLDVSPIMLYELISVGRQLNKQSKSFENLDSQ